MVSDLGIDFLAAGIGNIHGKYPENWEGLSFETLDAIQQLTGDMPLVLHGGTGIPEDMIKKAISLGVAKINVNTECQLAFAAATREYVEAGKDLEGKGFDPRKLLKPGTDAIMATVKRKWNYSVLSDKLKQRRSISDVCFRRLNFSKKYLPFLVGGVILTDRDMNRAFSIAWSALFVIATS